MKILPAVAHRPGRSRRSDSRSPTSCTSSKGKESNRSRTPNAVAIKSPATIGEHRQQDVNGKDGDCGRERRQRGRTPLGDSRSAAITSPFDLPFRRTRRKISEHHLAGSAIGLPVGCSMSQADEATQPDQRRSVQAPREKAAKLGTIPADGWSPKASPRGTGLGLCLPSTSFCAQRIDGVPPRRQC